MGERRRPFILAVIMLVLAVALVLGAFYLGDRVGWDLSQTANPDSRSFQQLPAGAAIVIIGIAAALSLLGGISGLRKALRN
jgi:amino acid transporter